MSIFWCVCMTQFQPSLAWRTSALTFVPIIFWHTVNLKFIIAFFYSHAPMFFFLFVFFNVLFLDLTKPGTKHNHKTSSPWSHQMEIYHNITFVVNLDVLFWFFFERKHSCLVFFNYCAVINMNTWDICEVCLDNVHTVQYMSLNVPYISEQ